MTNYKAKESAKVRATTWVEFALDDACYPDVGHHPHMLGRAKARTVTVLRGLVSATLTIHIHRNAVQRLVA
jgi:hypothetical protein